jgi:hypothetical protein
VLAFGIEEFFVSYVFSMKLNCKFLPSKKV